MTIIFVGPPFGNYFPSTTLFDSNNYNFRKIAGSFTLFPRKGLISQIFKTLHYSNKHNGWVNKIGLRNPGIDYAIKKYKDTNTIVSVAILDPTEVKILEQKIPKNMNIEINISCPNIDKQCVDNDIHIFLNSERKWCILKLSPLVTSSQIDNYYKNGWRQFHCSNTIPVENGGLSGKSIIPYTNKSINYISNTYPDALIIAGGGITNIEDINNYNAYGASHYSISTLLFNPFKFSLFLKDINAI